MVRKTKNLKILGISCYYHDSACSLIINGDIVSAVQEERFTRKKHDSSFPINSVKYCLEANNLSLKDIDIVIYYEKPLLTFERLLETYISVAPRGIRSFISAMTVWLKEKLFIKTQIKKELLEIEKQIVRNQSLKLNNFNLPKLLFSEHHLSHAASAFYPSPYEKSAILCMDGVGEWATTSAWLGDGKKISPIWEINFPHSLGLLYSAFTYYCGFKVNSGEYKLMGLAPYGKPNYVDLIKENLVHIKDDGSYSLNMKFFKFHRGFRMISSEFSKLFKQSPRKPESELTQFHMDLAASIQVVTEDIILLIARSLRKETNCKNLCLAGGVALNCVANGKLLKEKIFDNIWIQPASGDAGNALGAALVAWYAESESDRIVNPSDSMRGAYLGPSFSDDFILSYLRNKEIKFFSYEESDLLQKIAQNLADGKVIGWFSGAMEFGPRSLGARSIIGDPRNINMQSQMNLKIKYRESFRPFAPAILEDYVSEKFEINVKSPYMLMVAQVKKELCRKLTFEEEKLFGIEKLNIPRSTLPAITHVDFSARIQTVSSKYNPKFYKLIDKFRDLTGCPLVVNTSFNVRGEPIVCTPEDAYNCFMRTEMDLLVLENFVLFKEDQPKQKENKDWMKEFELD